MLFAKNLRLLAPKTFAKTTECGINWHMSPNRVNCRKWYRRKQNKAKYTMSIFRLRRWQNTQGPSRNSKHKKWTPKFLVCINARSSARPNSESGVCTVKQDKTKRNSWLCLIYRFGDIESLQDISPASFPHSQLSRNQLAIGGEDSPRTVFQMLNWLGIMDTSSSRS